ncbi:Hypothetical predicted protein [Xyrichtys novacula]|uniref:Uncharacterized protein n=1 Tax=Xyrichtys novacula TaxID=13765 RepID=A0AAV1EPY7_XYRNO|nr:Hypothetical predicted protein [Xyrichtys novacula]
MRRDTSSKPARTEGWLLALPPQRQGEEGQNQESNCTEVRRESESGVGEGGEMVAEETGKGSESKRETCEVEENKKEAGEVGGTGEAGKVAGEVCAGSAEAEAVVMKTCVSERGPVPDKGYRKCENVPSAEWGQ